MPRYNPNGPWPVPGAQQNTRRHKAHAKGAVVREREEPEVERRRPTLADRFVVRQFAAHERAIHPKAVDQIKAGVRYARRFVMDDAAVERLADIIIEIPDLLIREHQFAVAPYDLTWIELPGHIMFRKFREQNPTLYAGLGDFGDPDKADNMIGYLIDHERVNVVCAGTVEQPDQPVHILPVQYRIHTPWPAEDRAEFMRRAGVVVDWGNEPGKVPEDSEACDALLWGSTWNNITPEMRRDLGGRNTAEFLPSNPQHFNHDLWMDDGQMIDSIRGSIGEVRNIIALLLLMNRPSLTRYVRTNEPAKGFHKGKLMSYMQHTTVTIDLDAVPTLRLIGTPAGDAIPRRRGEVRGHFKHDDTARQYSRIAGCIHEFQPTHGPKDDWAPWPDAPPGIPGAPGCARNWVCAACGGKRWWTKKFERGDASVGYVNHDAYQITADD